MQVLKRFCLIAIFVCLLAALPTQAVRAQKPTPNADTVAEMMSRMSVEDKVGQLFLVPFANSNANPGSEVWQLITEYRVGGIILLTANSNFNNDESAPRQVAELSNMLKTTAFNTNGLPLFVAIDHEGDGYPYTRLTRGVTPIPSQMAIGATWDTSKAEAIGQVVGQELSAMGINLLLGPNLDVLHDPRPTGRGDIGIRVFGGDPYWVGQMGRAYIRGLHQGSNGQLAAVSKHFPGHGGSDRLPDNEVATVDKSLQELRRIELPPFFEATAEKETDPLGVTDALMSSHIRYRGFQGDIRQFTAPISFDAEGMSTLLTLPEIQPWRQDGGVIVSDALGVPAVRKHFDPTLQDFPHRRIAKEAFLAGNDILSLVQFDLKSIWSDQFANIKDTIFFFRTEYINNPTFAARVDEAVERILRLKLKLYPTLNLDALNRDPGQALGVASQQRPVVNEIAQKSLTLLYPSAARLPEPPRPGDKLLIINDSRFARECFRDNCEPAELFIPRNTLQDVILRLYGPGASGQVQPENISTITFSELKQALGGAILPLSDVPAGDEKVEENKAVQLSVDEVKTRIKDADWLIFAPLDLNISRYPDSDALKLFLSQESGTVRDKKIVVLAFNAPYYLDTTEVTKLTAYYGVYSKTQPHIEAAIRALFGEANLKGASPVSVEGIGYELVDVLAPNPEQDLTVELVKTSPDTGLSPVVITATTGLILDYNGNPVPDDTPVQFRAMHNGREITSATADTQQGRAQATFTVSEPGQIDVFAGVGTAESKKPVSVTVIGQSTPTPPPVTSAPTFAPTHTPNPTPTVVSATVTPPNPTAVVSTPVTTAPETPPPAAPNPAGVRRMDGLDLALALAAIFLAGMLGFSLKQQYRQPLNRRVKLGLWVSIGGLLAYVLYGIGWLRPEAWLLAAPTLTIERLTVVVMAFGFGLAALELSSWTNRR